jgi:mannose-1-phosphate guanylyltransferase
MLIPVILSGGSGTRLWPLSRTHYPKQYLSLVNDTTLFQDTILRLPKDVEDPLIICNEEHRFIVAEQLRQINKKSSGIILEPTGKNTAPAVTLAAIKLLSDFEDPTILVLSADHLIQDKFAFKKSITIGEKLANQGKLVTFGVTPTKAETGFGYIEILNKDAADSYEIKSFKEKPNEEVAKKYLDSGKYFWNSGMFMFKASIFLEELKHFEPQILSSCKKSFKTPIKDLDFIRLNNKEFNNCQNKSIDYAVMERTAKGVVIPLDANWSDIGSWSSLWEAKPKDKNKNVSSGDVILKEVKNSYIHSSSRLVSVLGLSDIAIIDTQDALLVANKSYAQNIKFIVDKLNKDKRSESNIHRRVYRPWGNYDSIDYGENFQVKRITVNPKSKLSLQKHKYRSEHWVIVKGTALITCGDKVFNLEENESTYIPQGAIHRIENSKKIPLEIIEIQTGSYLGEDDIIRLEDDYSRNEQ